MEKDDRGIFGFLYLVGIGLAVITGIAGYQGMEKRRETMKDYSDLPTSQKAVVESYDKNRDGFLAKDELVEMLKHYDLVRKPVEVEERK